MIIGNNNNNNNNNNPLNMNSNFQNRYNRIIEEGNKNQDRINPFKDDSPTTRYTDVNNKKEMLDKSFSMLQERFNNGLITLEEFNKKCRELNKLRQK